jgi:hypothetical protein
MRFIAITGLLTLSLATSAVAKPARRHVAAARRTTSAPAPKRAPAPAPATTTTTTTETAAAPSESGDEAAPAADAKGATPATKVKTKTYTFGAMDVEGKLKTPQLLYFLNRVKLELDMSAPDKRSFMKELAQSADDKSL